MYIDVKKYDINYIKQKNKFRYIIYENQYRKKQRLSLSTNMRCSKKWRLKMVFARFKFQTVIFHFHCPRTIVPALVNFPPQNGTCCCCCCCCWWCFPKKANQMWQAKWKVWTGLLWGCPVVPLPRNSDHPDDITCLVGNPNLNLHLRLASWQGCQPTL